LGKNDNYYGSVLNEFIDKNCSHQMTCMNIDCFMLKRSKRRIRIIESKHINEKMPYPQLEGLKAMKTFTPRMGWTLEVYIVTGNPPYETAEVQEIDSDKIYKLNRSSLIEWLNFEKELKDLQSITTSLEDFPNA